MSAILFEFKGGVRLLVPSTTGDKIDAKLTADTVFESILPMLLMATTSRGEPDGSVFSHRLLGIPVTQGPTQ